MREKLSVFVVTYNRASLLESCLRAASFADELIVVDKSSTDGSASVAARYADRVEQVPWSPTVEETRAFASSLCRHERILFLDDDEILSPEAGPWLREHLTGSGADIHAIPLRHYMLGVHDEQACYWPEAHHRLFRKGAVEFVPIVHGGMVLKSDRIASVPLSSGVCIHHLSHPDVASFIERTNRYTGRPDRARITGGEGDLIQFAHDRIDYWSKRTAGGLADGYAATIVLLRATYDIVDRLKTWEENRGVDGAALFRLVQERLAMPDEASAVTDLAQAPTGVWPDSGRTDQPTNLPPSTGMTIPVLDVRSVTAAITA
jgi:glycosyltransferase involved in cell wall biosynthesis